MEMKDRIKAVRKEAGLLQPEFAERIGIKGPTVTSYETGSRTPSDAVIISISREFGVSETWLRTGEGAMKIQMSEDAEFINIMAQIQVSDDRIKEALKLYWNLPAEKKAVIWELVDQLAKK